MSPEIITQDDLLRDPEWNPPEPPGDLIFDDGVPLESNRHRIAMNVLIDSAQMALVDNPNSFVGGNMFVYYSRDQAMNRDFRGPDFLAVLDVDPQERQGWVSWEEDGRYPDVIIELLSPSTASSDRGAKKDIYERIFHTADYFIFDPFEPTSLEGWHLVGRTYQPIQPSDYHGTLRERGWLWCETLGLWLGTWEGRLRREPAQGTCNWLRMYDRAGNLVPLPEDIAEQERDRANQQQQRAERLAARLRELGEDPDSL